MNHFSQLESFGRAISVATRIRILAILASGPKCVGALSMRLDVTQGAVSQHLRVLRDAGLVTAERRGYHVHYSLSDGRVREMLDMAAALLLDSGDDQNGCPAHTGGSDACANRKKNA